MASDSPAEIKAKFVLDSNADKVLDTIKGGFGKVDSAINYTKNELVSFVKQGAAMALGFQFDRGIQSLRGFASEAMDTAKAAGAEVKAIAGVLAIHDKEGRTLVELKGQAAEYREHLVNIGIASGASASSVVEAFNDISERSDKSVSENEALVKQMVMAGKVVPGGLSSITEGYRMMEMGMIRARNPLVQLITQTHMLKGSAKDVAKEMQKMKPEEAMKIANKAIEFMATKAAASPLGGGMVIQQIKDMSDQAMEGAGNALLKAMSKPYVIIRDLMLENKGELGALYTMAGKALGDVVLGATEKAKEAINYIKGHSAEIRDNIKSGWETAQKVATFIIDHKKEIGFGLAAVSAAHMAPAAMGMASSVAGGVSTGANAAWSLLKFVGSNDVPAMTRNLGGLSRAYRLSGEVVNGFLFPAITTMSAEAKTLSNSIGAATKGFGAMALAAGALYLAFDQYTKLMDDLHATENSRNAGIANMDALAREGNSERLRDTIASEKAIGRISEDRAVSLQLMADMADKQFDVIKAQADRGLSGANAGVTDPLLDMGDAFNQAAGIQNNAAKLYAARVILASGTTAEAMDAMGVKMAGGLDEFGKLFDGASEDVLAKLKHFMGGDKTPLKALAPHIDFSGSKFEIHQDFRNEDPDRIMLMFRNDILSAAEHRKESRMGSGFGP